MAGFEISFERGGRLSIGSRAGADRATHCDPSLRLAQDPVAALGVVAVDFAGVEDRHEIEDF